MKEAFTPGTLVQDKYGNTYRISDRLNTRDWKVPGYLGEGFYSVDVVTPIEWAGAPRIQHEDDLQLVKEVA
jgi:hypothetical protein